MTGSKMIKCNNVDYRKGYIEITPCIHEGCINIETWDIHVDVDLSTIEIGDDDFPEDGVTGNTEIEMNITEAEHLVTQLQMAITKVKASAGL